MSATTQARILRALSTLFEFGDERALRAIANDLERRSKSLTETRHRSMHIAEQSSIDPSAILDALEKTSTREQGELMLADLQLSRKELTQIAKLGDVHVVKEDTVSVIVEKLVEAIIGARLRSAAVRGTTN